ncbi:MAG: CinA family protein [Gemmatimonadota bacterium]|jgi:nicotinamide-nucleotide amidase|nr:CinA family protein [Gemmatimonadota bacterium]MDP6802708.1 CinA family protein [Gemmatimonadota bacterium]MDP7032516.1 CinA family protein [Gemmatimonadota bacterium]
MKCTAGENTPSEEALERVLVRELERAEETLATAESCTGGGIGARITEVPGASAVYAGGVVAYSNRIKVARLGVADETLEQYGAVSSQVAREMAEGCRRAFEVDLSLAVTGIAGPGGGLPGKPVGTVWIAISDAAGTTAREFRFSGDRGAVRERSVNKALEIAYRRLRSRL